MQPDVAGAVFSVGASSIVNQGRVAAGADITITISPTAFTNSGTLEVTAGGRIDVRPTTFTNFTNLTSDNNTFITALSGGTYKVADSGVLRLYPSTSLSTLFRIQH